MIKLIVSDLDGTLLQENHLMNQEAIDEIKKQMARGVDFMWQPAVIILVLHQSLKIPALILS